MRRPALASGLLVIAATGGASADELSGNLLLGWRDVSVDGDDNKYSQHVNLEDGARLLGFRLDYRADEPATGLPNSASIDVTGLGGDPFQRIQLRVRDVGSYDFRYEHRRSEYFYDDLLIDPSDASVEGSTGGDFHSFDTVRETDRASLGISLTPRASLSLGFDRYGRSGNSTTTRDFERDEFELDQPVDENLETVSLGFSYRWDRSNLLLEHSLRDFESNNPVFLPGFSEGANSDPEDLTTLDFYFFEQPWGYDSRESSVRFGTRPTDRFEISLGASVTDLDATVLGEERAQGDGFDGSPVVIDESGDGAVRREIGLYDVSLRYDVSPRIGLTATLNSRQLDQAGAFELGPDDGSGDWQVDTTGGRLGIDVSLRKDLLLGAGWSTETRQVDILEEAGGVRLPVDSETDRDGFYASVSYRPDAAFDLSARIESNRIGDPFTLASPTDTTRYRLRGRFRFGDGWSLVAIYRLTDLDNDNSGWSAKNSQTSLRIAYADDRLRLNAGASSIDLTQNFEVLVTGGSRQDLFASAYRGDTLLIDARIDYSVVEGLDVFGAFRRYDNDGSFDVERDDFSVGAFLALPRNYRVGLDYRRVDYTDKLEAYDADIIELSLGLAW